MPPTDGSQRTQQHHCSGCHTGYQLRSRRLRCFEGGNRYKSSVFGQFSGCALLGGSRPSSSGQAEVTFAICGSEGDAIKAFRGSSTCDVCWLVAVVAMVAIVDGMSPL